MINVTFSVNYNRFRKQGTRSLTVKAEMPVLPKEASIVYIATEEVKRDRISGYGRVLNIIPCILEDHVHYTVEVEMTKLDSEITTGA